MTVNTYLVRLSRSAILLCVAALIYFAWVEIRTYAALWTLFNYDKDFSLFAGHLVGTVFLLITLYPYTRILSNLHLGSIKHIRTFWFILAMFILYIGYYLLEKALGIPAEPFVKTIFDKPFAGQISVALTIFLLAPIGEEIVFRGYLINPLLEWNKWLMWAVIILGSILFASLHSGQYRFLTLTQLFAFSVIVAAARIQSGGLLLPIILHIDASVVAVLLDG